MTKQELRSPEHPALIVGHENVAMWRGNSNYSICKEGNCYCAALSGLPRGKAGAAGRAGGTGGISCLEPPELFCPALQCLSPGACSKKHLLDQGRVGSLSRVSGSHHSVCSLVISGLLLVFSLTGMFRAVLETGRQTRYANFSGACYF